MLLTSPPSVTNCHTFSDPLPLERDVLYGRPLMHSSRPTLDTKYIHEVDLYTKIVSYRSYTLLLGLRKYKIIATPIK